MKTGTMAFKEKKNRLIDCSEGRKEKQKFCNFIINPKHNEY